MTNDREMFESRISAGAKEKNYIHQFREEEIGSVVELSTVCSQISEW